MNDEELIKFLKKKFKNHDTSNFNFFDFMHAFGLPSDAIFYSRLFWPEFVEIDGMVFFKEEFETEEDRNRLNEALQHYDGNKTKTEQSFNLIEVPSLFGKNLGEMDEEMDQNLAQSLAKFWSRKMHVDYPEKQFKVEVLSEEDTGGEIGILFYTARD